MRLHLKLEYPFNKEATLWNRYKIRKEMMISAGIIHTLKKHISHLMQDSTAVC